jgi:bifunctional non-homologous end joining protein LigD
MGTERAAEANQPWTKVTVARAQLVTALDLFARDKDPISIQCLACGGGEVIQALAEAHGEEPLAMHILSTQPRMDRWAVRKLRNQYWNAFKHVSDRSGLPREDEELLGRFNDTVNDAALFVGWWDYMALQKRLPVSAQVFQVWWYAIYEEKLSPEADLWVIRTAFPDIRQQPRVQQKRRLRRMIEKWRKNRELLAHPATEASARKKPPAIGTKADFPGLIEPALATSIGKVPSGHRWLHEIKFDGYRVQVHIDNDAVKVFTRRDNDWTKRMRKIADDARRISASSAIIDGEVVVPGENGTTDFSVLQNELKGTSTKIVFVAFDLLYLNGGDLRKLTLIERKAHLKTLIDGTAIQFSESFEIDGPKMYAHACKVGLEGVVSKVRDSAYISGRTNSWVKKTCAQRETLIIAGYALNGAKFDGIYLARRKGADLIYAGKVDHGFDKASAADLLARLKPLIRKTQPYTKQIAHKGIWAEPKLMAEIEYRAKSAEGKVRHPFSRACARMGMNRSLPVRNEKGRRGRGRRPFRTAAV